MQWIREKNKEASLDIPVKICVLVQENCIFPNLIKSVIQIKSIKLYNLKWQV